MCRCATKFYGKVEASSQRQHSQIQCGCKLLCVVWYVFSSLCPCVPRLSASSVSIFLFVAVVPDAVTPSGLAEAVTTKDTAYRLGTARTCSTGAELVGGPRGPVKLIGELTVYTAGELVVGYSAPELTSWRSTCCSAPCCTWLLHWREIVLTL